MGETGNVANDWMQSFGGGLMVTCGLRNVGVPSEGHGQHGDYTFQRADVEAVERSGDALIVQGTISEVASLGHHLHVARTWRTYAGRGLVQLECEMRRRRGTAMFEAHRSRQRCSGQVVGPFARRHRPLQRAGDFQPSSKPHSRSLRLDTAREAGESALATL